MNLFQFLERWPKKESRLFLFGGGKDHDRLAAYYMVCDRWRQQVDTLDFVWLHKPSMIEVSETCRRDPLTSKYRIVAATEMPWPDPDEAQTDEEGNDRIRRRQHFETLHKLTSKMPRDLVLIMSTPHENPLTKNDLAQSIITKGYWVVLKNADVDTAVKLVVQLTGWDEDLCFEVVESVGTSPADIVSFLKVIRLVSAEPTQEQVQQYLGGYVRGTVFELTDAIVAKDLTRALNLAAYDIPMGQLVGALDRKFTSLVAFISELRRGRTPKEAAMMLRLPGFIVHGLYEASKRWNTSELLMMFPILAEYYAKGQRPGSTELMIHELIGA